jgi:SAM-dependent methyltransferase
MKSPFRICIHCGTAEEIGDDEAVWPAERRCPACARPVETRDGMPLFAAVLADTIAGIDPVAFERLAKWEKDNFWFVPRSRLIEGLLARYFPTAETMMEIGCGTGFVLSGIASSRPWRRLVGSELHTAGLAYARRRLGDRAEFVQMDARWIPARDVFDIVGAFDVLEHIEEDEAVLAAMYRALCRGGGIVLTVPQHPWLWSNMDQYALHVRRYSRGELERKVQRAGFRVLFSASYTALLLPFLAGSRWTRGRNGPEAVGKEFELPKIGNDLLKAVLQLEVSLTLAGLRFPAGGSRVVVAIKSDAQTIG